MAHVDGCADCALARIEIGPDCIEGGGFHDHDHDGSGEHRWQDRVLEPVRKMLGLDEEGEEAFGLRAVSASWLAATTDMMVQISFRREKAVVFRGEASGVSRGCYGILVLGQSSRTRGVLLASSSRYSDDRIFGGNQRHG
jgi:hypothetical protein